MFVCVGFSSVETRLSLLTTCPSSCVFPPGPHQCQGSRVSAQGRPQCPHPSSHNPWVGQVLSPALWWILHPAVDWRHPLLPCLRHPGSHWGRSCRRQCEQCTHALIRIRPIYTSLTHPSHFWLWSTAKNNTAILVWQKLYPVPSHSPHAHMLHFVSVSFSSCTSVLCSQLSSSLLVASHTFKRPRVPKLWSLSRTWCLR